MADCRLFATNYIFAETYTTLLMRVDRAVSFALMDREGSHEAFTFDKHFAQRGHRMLPSDQ